MQKTIYDLLEKRNFNNYMIEVVSETVIEIYDIKEKSSVMLDFDNCLIFPSNASYGSFRYLLKLATVAIEAIGSNIDEWSIAV